MKVDKQSLDELLVELKLGLNTIYGERLKSIFLYVSYARGEEEDESDLELLVILDQFNSYAREVDRTAELASDLSIKYGITVSLVFVREAEWLDGDTPFLSNVRDEAISV
jgi:predicted nucleotidyltransferase